MKSQFACCLRHVYCLLEHWLLTGYYTVKHDFQPYIDIQCRSENTIFESDLWLIEFHFIPPCLKTN